MPRVDVIVTNRATVLTRDGLFFDPTLSRYDAQSFDTYYQIQLALRYTF
jgi:hypothetical protein